MTKNTCNCHGRCTCQDYAPTEAPLSVVNSAGASVLARRIGQHDSFLTAMNRRLSSNDYPQLQQLRARKTTDPSIALLDAWSTVGDVLTFYNERIVNEGFLRTATERRSLVELSNLIGYSVGPGVASSVYLAFNLQKDPKQTSEETIVPAGTAVKSVPGDQESAQTFETSEDLTARMEWNAIRPRLDMPQSFTRTSLGDANYLYLEGTRLKVKPQDCLFVFPQERETPVPLVVTAVDEDVPNNRTRLSLRESPFSRQALSRDTKLAAEGLAAAIPAPVTIPLKLLSDANEVLLNGDSNKLTPLSTTSALADVEQRIAKVYVQAQLLQAQACLSELTQATPPANSYLLLSKRIQQVVETDALQWIAALKLRLDELALYQVLSTKLQTINTDLNGDFSAGKISAAQDACTQLPATPTSSLFPTYQANIKKWIDLINALDAGTTSTQTDYTTALPDLLRWWNGTINKPEQQAAIQSLGDQVAALIVKSQVATTNGFPFAGFLEYLLDTFPKALDAIAEPVKTTKVGDRIVEVKTTIVGAVDIATHIANLDAIRTSVNIPASSPIPLIDDLLQQLRSKKVVWDAAASDILKHKSAIDTATTLNALMQEYIGLATAILNDVLESTNGTSGSLADVIQLRRKAFREAMVQITNAFQDLGSNPARNAQDAAKALNTAAQAISLLKGTTDSPLFGPAALLLDDAAATPTGAIPSLKSNPEPRTTPLGQRIDSLVEQLVNLRRVIFEPGDSTLASATGGTLSGGGLPTVVERGNAGDQSQSTTVRIADEVLSVPLNAASDIIPQLVAAMHVSNVDEMEAAWRNVTIPYVPPRVSLVGGTSPLFGQSAIRALLTKKLKLITTPVAGQDEWALASNAVDCMGRIYLAQEVTTLAPWGSVYLQYADHSQTLFDYAQRVTVSRSDYGLNSKCTELTMTSGTDWRKVPGDTDFGQLRTTIVKYETEVFQLSTLPITRDIGQDTDDSATTDDGGFDIEGADEIELDGLYLGLQAGKQIIVQGELSQSPGVIRSEIVAILCVRHILRPVAGDSVHSRIVLEQKLSNRFKRDTVTIACNVVRATHGETVKQVLGSGDASQSFQTMALAKSPLTYLPAPTPSGVASTLAIWANNLLWHEQDTLLESAAADRDYSIEMDANSRTLVQFGDGKTGARLPTGRENVRAQYRVGLGTAGNVNAGKITQLANRPLGVKDVINPTPATGGADPETVNQIRGNAPLAVTALDRLVSVQDYADFARNYSSIDKAVSKRLLLGGQPTVHVTIAGVDDIPIDDQSDLLVNLRRAYIQLGDPLQVVDIRVRELLLLFLSVNVRLKADYDWDTVQPLISDALYQSFGFSSRELAQDIYLSEVQTVIQHVDGVEYSDVEVFATLAQADFQAKLAEAAGQSGGPVSGNQSQDNSSSASVSSTTNPLDSLFKELRQARPVPPPRLPVADAGITSIQGKLVIRPAQIAYLSRQVPDSLFLLEIKN